MMQAPARVLERELELRCVGCGRRCAMALVQTGTEVDLRRVAAFFGAYRCGACWTAWMNDRDARRAAARARTMGVAEPVRRSVYSEANEYQQPYQQPLQTDRWGRPAPAYSG